MSVPEWCPDKEKEFTAVEGKCSCLEHVERREHGSTFCIGKTDRGDHVMCFHAPVAGKASEPVMFGEHRLFASLGLTQAQTQVASFRIDEQDMELLHKFVHIAERRHMR